MAQTVTLGGDRLGSGKKQTVELHNYMMSSFNLEQDFKSSMAPGILYPFLKMIGTNHGTFDINLDSFIRTLPTRGPLFGSYKFQADIFCVPIRLYQGILHNNPVDIGLKMNQVYLPKILVPGQGSDTEDTIPMAAGSNKYNYQISESSLLKYLGLSGIGTVGSSEGVVVQGRKINAVPVLAYYDIFKNYYSNKQEELAYVITPNIIAQESITANQILIDPNNGTSEGYVTRTGIEIQPINGFGETWTLTLAYKVNIQDFELTDNVKNRILDGQYITITYSNGTDLIVDNDTLYNDEFLIAETTWRLNDNPDGTKTIQLTLTMTKYYATNYIITKIEVNNSTINLNIYNTEIHLESFELKNIDTMRNRLLSHNTLGDEFIIDNTTNLMPYSALVGVTDNIPWNAFTDNGLVVKTYQSDLFNNWLNTETIETINSLASVNVTNGSFEVDALNFAEKVYNVLNRIGVSGGTYEDWQEAIYGAGAIRKAETPMYIGGMSAEIMFEEVISSSETQLENGQGYQPLGSLGGKGTQVGKHGGNNIHVKCEEPCYIIGIASITPRIAYSQGNDWDLTELDSLDDLHKPGFDGIGFQDLMIEQMAWWNTPIDPEGRVGRRQSAGKQIAWINYQTAVDKVYGDFAKQDGIAFMVLNRNYERTSMTSTAVNDITTYIDPAKWNYVFADANLAAQNFWVQIHSDVVARRKMASQQIPNL